MTTVAYLVPGVGLDEAEASRRADICNELVDADVEVLVADRGPKSIESEVEHEWSVLSSLELIRANEATIDAFVIGCFGDPGIAAARELTDVPVVGPAAATFHVASQLSDRFTCLTIRDTPASKRRQIRQTHLDSQLASVRVVETGVLDIHAGKQELIDEMIAETERAVAEDGAEAAIPGCMSLAFMRAQQEVASAVEVPFLDPVGISLETARMFAKHDIRASRLTYPKFDGDRYESLFD